MRFLTWALACTLGGALGVALADEPSKTPPPSTASSDAASPPAAAAAAAPAAAPAAASTSAAKPDVNAEVIDRHFRSEGYKVEVRNGEKWYCKPIIETGTRLASSQPVCVPGQQLLMKERQQQEDLEKAQRIMGHPTGG